MDIVWFFVKSVVWSLSLLGLAGVVLDVITHSGLNCTIALITAGGLLITSWWRRWQRPYRVSIAGGLSILGLVVLLAAGNWDVAGTLLVIGSLTHGLFLATRALCRAVARS